MAVGHPDEKSYLTPQHIMSRWFALISGTLAIVASQCVSNLFAATGNLNLRGACNYTAIMLSVFSVLSALFYCHKKSLNEAAKDEEKEGLMNLTPSEALDLTVNEGLNNLTNAMASILAGLWFGILQLGGILNTFKILYGGCAVLLIGEALQRQLKPGGLAEYVVNMLNGMNCGNVSWWLGYSVSNNIQNWFGCPNGQSACLSYWVFAASFVWATINLEFINFLSTKTPKTGAGAAYGKLLFTMLKGYPMFATGLVLNNIVQFQDSHAYVSGTVFWSCLTVVAVLAFDQFVHMPSYKALANAYISDPKEVMALVNEVVTLIGQVLSFIVGQLATFALAEHFKTGIIPTGAVCIQGKAGRTFCASKTVIFWCVFAAFWQVLSFLFQSARTQCLPRIFKKKDASTDYQKIEPEA